MGGALVLSSIAIEVVGRLWDLNRYPNPLRGIQLALFVSGCVLFGQSSRRMLRRSEQFAERVNRQDES